MADHLIPLQALKGRGAASRLPHRFERDVRDDFDDGWNTLQDEAAEGLPPLQTEVRFEDVKSVLSENDSPDIPFDRSLNPYRGCEHVMCPRTLLHHVTVLAIRHEYNNSTAAPTI